MELAQMELAKIEGAQMEMRAMKLAPMEITQTRTEPGSPLAPALMRRFARMSALAGARLKVLWRSVNWRSLLCRAASKRKTLAVRETAALGDRRFVSVIQFEQQRFLIGSSPAAVTLLAQLPDVSPSPEVTGEKL
jgi:flagellar biogenesis protein FliO